MVKVITATELKLLKAKYYLRRMKETKDNPYYLDFICELESFLMHAKSVTNLPKPLIERGRYDDSCYMEQEFKDKAHFDTWHAQKVREIENNPINNSIMVFLRQERNVVVHFKGRDISVMRTTEIAVTDFTPSHESIEVTVIKTDGAKETFKSSPEPVILPQNSESSTKYNHTFKTDRLMNEKDVILVCEQYMSILEELLEDCRKQGFL